MNRCLRLRMSEEGSEDSPIRSRRKIKKVGLLSSASESDSDDSVGVAVTRRKRLRVNAGLKLNISGAFTCKILSYKCIGFSGSKR